jgi:hypothetical protein
MAKQVASEAKEPRNWRRKIDPKKHRGGKPVEYGFKQMLSLSFSLWSTIERSIERWKLISRTIQIF